MQPHFADRADAGRQLVPLVAPYVTPDSVVYALPRGGIIVGAEIAAAFQLPLDVVLVRKIGVPGNPEVAMGAVVDGVAPSVVFNREVVAAYRVRDTEIDRIKASELGEIERRRILYAPFRTVIDPMGRHAIVVDDGIATGATVRAAVDALNARGARSIVVAAPVASRSACESLAETTDAVVCHEIADFGSVGRYFDDFRQLSDAETLIALQRCRGTARSAV